MRILMAILLFTFMSGMAAAVPVDASAPNGIAAQFVEVPWEVLQWVLCTDNNICLARYDTGVSGEWELIESSCWPSGFPFPLSEIVDWIPQHGSGGDQNDLYYETAILRSGQVWVNRGGWVAIPPLSCNGAVKSEDGAFGKLKSMFR